MSRLFRSRRLLALFAAYVVALQALLLPLTVAAFALPETGLCVTVAGESSRPPVSHDTGCGCAAGCGMQCCAQTLLGPPVQDGVASRAARVSVIAPPTVLTAIARPTARGPQAPRAPPAA